ncbi:ATPase, T2SS/T4P/T4SS family [Alteromonas antoniana]|uniref:ATPase, T2SS/T4P/T4SS family n=1 Tax=Alteromonas antoniana TaxID=2803813 RepID=UPI001C492633|nr:ATPase, T2SS/T4P/T4SS family [Alteromonas antoniana]
MDEDKFLCKTLSAPELTFIDFIHLFRHALQIDSFSDIYIRIGHPIIIRSQGTNYRLSSKPRLTRQDVKNFVCGYYDEGIWGDVRSGSEYIGDFQFSKIENDLRGKHTVRMRTIITKEQSDYDPSGVMVTMRLIENDIPTVQKLNVDKNILDAAFPRQGLVIIAGETGSGKTTLLAAFINEILTYKGMDRPDVVLAEYSDPPEYLFHNVDKGRNIITQNWVGPRHDTKTFEQGILNAKRMNTTHILIGECRNKESIDQMYDASNIGNACYTTFHANKVSGVIKGMAQKFEADREMMRAFEIARNTSLIVVQYLAKMGDNRVPIQEYLAFDEQVKNRLENVPAERFYSEIDKCVEAYGQPMRQDADRALAAGEIDASVHKIIISGCG